jgi:hypothetical protein
MSLLVFVPKMVVSLCRIMPWVAISCINGKPVNDMARNKRVFERNLPALMFWGGRWTAFLGFCFCSLCAVSVWAQPEPPAGGPQTTHDIDSDSSSTKVPLPQRVAPLAGASRSVVLAGRTVEINALRTSIARRLVALGANGSTATTSRTIDLARDHRESRNLDSPAAAATFIVSRLAQMDFDQQQVSNLQASRIKMGLLLAWVANQLPGQPRLAADICEAYVLPLVPNCTMPHYCAGGPLTTLESVSHYFYLSRQPEKVAWIQEWALEYDPRGNGRDGLLLLLHQYFRRRNPEKARSLLNQLGENTRITLGQKLRDYYNDLPQSVLEPDRFDVPTSGEINLPLSLEEIP